MAGTKAGTPFYAQVITRAESSHAVANGVFHLAIVREAALVSTGTFDLFIDSSGDTATVVTQLNLVLQAESLNLKVYEDTDWTDGTGTLINTLNVNRVAAAAGIDALKETILRDGSTLNAIGTLIADWDQVGIENIGGATNIVDAEIEVPVVLKPNTKYLIRVENTGSVTGDLQIAMQFIDRVV